MAHVFNAFNAFYAFKSLKRQKATSVCPPPLHSPPLCTPPALHPRSLRNRAATELQQSCNRGAMLPRSATEVQCSWGALQQRCNRAATAATEVQSYPALHPPPSRMHAGRCVCTASEYFCTSNTSKEAEGKRVSGTYFCTSKASTFVLVKQENLRLRHVLRLPVVCLLLVKQVRSY